MKKTTLLLVLVGLCATLVFSACTSGGNSGKAKELQKKVDVDTVVATDTTKTTDSRAEKISFKKLSLKEIQFNIEFIDDKKRKIRLEFVDTLTDQYQMDGFEKNPKEKNKKYFEKFYAALGQSKPKEFSIGINRKGTGVCYVVCGDFFVGDENNSSTRKISDGSDNVTVLWMSVGDYNRNNGMPNPHIPVYKETVL